MSGAANILEAVMVISFGLSWPMSILKSLRSKTTKGKSLFFLCMVFFGYFCGVLSKLFSGHITYVFIFYALNLVMVGIDLIIYAINRRREKAQ